MRHGKSSCQFGDQCANRAGLGAHSRLQRLAELASGVAKSVIEGGTPSDQVGSVRVLTLQNGAAIRERLLEMSDLGHHYSYAILQIAVTRGELSGHLAIAPGLRRQPDVRRVVSDFDADPPEKQAETEDFISNAVFQGGFDALNKHFGG